MRNCEWCGNNLLKYQKYCCSNSCRNKRRYDLSDKLDITQEIHEMIEGTLFSDAYLSIGKTHLNPKYALTQCSAHRDYVIDIMKKLGFTEDKLIERERNHWGKDTYTTEFYTNHSKYLKPYLDRWYPSGKKIIPKDFKVTPISLFHIFVCDGCNHKRFSRNRTKLYNGIYIATNNFSQNDLETIIVPQLSILGIESHVLMHKGTNGNIQPLTFISRPSNDTFFNFIGPCPIDCFRYKWPDNNLTAHRGELLLKDTPLF